jgi:hypothetical protein
MYHSNIIPYCEISPRKLGKRVVQVFFSTYDDALSKAAILLGGRRGVRLLISIKGELEQPDAISRRLHRQLIDFRNLLFLEYAHAEEWGDTSSFALLEPDDPAVPEICLLADSLEDTLCKAGLLAELQPMGA